MLANATQQAMLLSQSLLNNFVLRLGFDLYSLCVIMGFISRLTASLACLVDKMRLLATLLSLARG